MKKLFLAILLFLAGPSWLVFAPALSAVQSKKQQFGEYRSKCLNAKKLVEVKMQESCPQGISKFAYNIAFECYVKNFTFTDQPSPPREDLTERTSQKLLETKLAARTYVLNTLKAMNVEDFEKIEQFAYENAQALAYYEEAFVFEDLTKRIPQKLLEIRLAARRNLLMTLKAANVKDYEKIEQFAYEQAQELATAKEQIYGKTNTVVVPNPVIKKKYVPLESAPEIKKIDTLRDELCAKLQNTSLKCLFNDYKKAFLLPGSDRTTIDEFHRKRNAKAGLLYGLQEVGLNEQQAIDIQKEFHAAVQGAVELKVAYQQEWDEYLYPMGKEYVPMPRKIKKKVIRKHSPQEQPAQQPEELPAHIEAQQQLLQEDSNKQNSLESNGTSINNDDSKLPAENASGANSDATPQPKAISLTKKLIAIMGISSTGVAIAGVLGVVAALIAKRIHGNNKEAAKKEEPSLGINLSADYSY